jgi:hypothetical protein
METVSLNLRTHCGYDGTYGLSRWEQLVEKPERGQWEYFGEHKDASS